MAVKVDAERDGIDRLRKLIDLMELMGLDESSGNHISQVDLIKLVANAMSQTALAVACVLHPDAGRIKTGRMALEMVSAGVGKVPFEDTQDDKRFVTFLRARMLAELEILTIELRKGE